MATYRAQVREVPVDTYETGPVTGYEARVIDGRGRVVEIVRPTHGRGIGFWDGLEFARRADAEEAAQSRAEQLQREDKPLKPGPWTDV